MPRKRGKTLCSSDVFSHPGKPLHVHLENVADRSVDKFNEDRPALDVYFSSDHWRNILWITGFLHDFGKATSYFQDYLNEPDERRKKALKGSNLTSHSLLSAVVTHVLVSRYVADHPVESDLWPMMPLFAFLVVKKHHGNLLNAARLPGRNDDGTELDSGEFEVLDEQFTGCYPLEIERILEMIHKKTRLNLAVSDLPGSYTDYYKKSIRSERRRLDKLHKTTEYYFIFHYLYSLLLHSDKEDAIFSRAPLPGRKKIPADTVKRFIETRFGSPESPMDMIRTGIFRDAERSISTVDLDKHRIFSLNVPTGTGKTLTALSVALKLKERLEKMAISPRIVYTLPFTSIIDQNHDVFREVLSDPGSDVLLKHHHMADITYRYGEDEFETGEAKFLIESWESEIVVTTLFQVFHTLFSNRNKMIQKFSKFANAIVLFDEIQSLPFKYWRIAKTTMTCMASLFNTRFILITATQPRIFDKDEIVELVPDKNDYFSRLDRVTLSFHGEPLTLTEFADLCRREIESSDESFLFVMNTVNAALGLFQALCANRQDADYNFLSTNIIPRHRLQRIRDIKKEFKRKIIVSTQMIEAGVDIDVENVFRDFGPLESINQVCGRCNRNFRNGKKGRVRLFQVLDDKNKNTPFERYIYGKSPLSMMETRAILSGGTEISECGFLDNMDSYYNRIAEKSRLDESESLRSAMENLQFENIYKEFKLIDEEGYERKDVFIEYDENAADVWLRYLEIRSIQDSIRRKEMFLKIKKDFHDYIISVPARFVSEEPYDNGFYVYINKDMLPTCYDGETGWIRTTGGTYSF